MTKRHRQAAEMHEYLQWDVYNWSRAVDFWTASGALDMLAGSRVLEVGARDGGLTLWLLRNGAERVVCSDLEGPSQAAVELHRRSGCADQVDYRALDATAFLGDCEFDVVVFKSVLGGIGGASGLSGQARAVDRMHAALRPGGVLLFAENLAASPVHRRLRQRFVKWSPRWRYVTEPEVRVMTEKFRAVRLGRLGFAGAFGRSEEQRRVLGSIDAIGLEKAVPRSWNYIVTGLAIK